MSLLTALSEAGASAASLFKRQSSIPRFKVFDFVCSALGMRTTSTASSALWRFANRTAGWNFDRNERLESGLDSPVPYRRIGYTGHRLGSYSSPLSILAARGPTVTVWRSPQVQEKLSWSSAMRVISGGQGSSTISPVVGQITPQVPEVGTVSSATRRR